MDKQEETLTRAVWKEEILRLEAEVEKYRSAAHLLYQVVVDGKWPGCDTDYYRDQFKWLDDEGTV